MSSKGCDCYLKGKEDDEVFVDGDIEYVCEEKRIKFNASVTSVKIVYVIVYWLSIKLGLGEYYRTFNDDGYEFLEKNRGKLVVSFTLRKKKVKIYYNDTRLLSVNVFTDTDEFKTTIENIFNENVSIFVLYKLIKELADWYNEVHLDYNPRVKYCLLTETIDANGYVIKGFYGVSNKEYYLFPGIYKLNKFNKIQLDKSTFKDGQIIYHIIPKLRDMIE